MKSNKKVNLYTILYDLCKWQAYDHLQIFLDKNKTVIDIAENNWQIFIDIIDIASPELLNIFLNFFKDTKLNGNDMHDKIQKIYLKNALLSIMDRIIVDEIMQELENIIISNHEERRIKALEALSSNLEQPSSDKNTLECGSEYSELGKGCNFVTTGINITNIEDNDIYIPPLGLRDIDSETD